MKYNVNLYATYEIDRTVTNTLLCFSRPLPVNHHGRELNIHRKSRRIAIHLEVI